MRSHNTPNKDITKKEFSIDGHIRDHRENFKKTAHLNPFSRIGSGQRSLSDSFWKTYHIFAGYRFEDSLWSKKIQKKEDQGLFHYILGLPSHYIYSIVPQIGAGIKEVGDGIFILTTKALEAMGKTKRSKLIRNITFPLWLPLVVAAVIVSIGLMLAGTVVFYVSEALLHPINWLVQKAVVPALSLLTTAALFVTGILPLVHVLVNFCMPDSRARGYVDLRYFPTNTNTSTGQVQTELQEKNGSTISYNPSRLPSSIPSSPTTTPVHSSTTSSPVCPFLANSHTFGISAYTALAESRSFLTAPTIGPQNNRNNPSSSQNSNNTESNVTASSRGQQLLSIRRRELSDVFKSVNTNNGSNNDSDNDNDSYSYSDSDNDNDSDNNSDNGNDYYKMLF